MSFDIENLSSGGATLISAPAAAGSTLPRQPAILLTKRRNPILMTTDGRFWARSPSIQGHSC